MEGGIRFQRGLLGQDPGEPVNIEQLATACLRLKARVDNPITPYVSGWNQRLIDLEKATPNLLDEYTAVLFGRLRDELKTPADEAISYLTHLGDFRQEAEVEMFTLNYDLCFERAFGHIMPAKIVNGFTKEGWTPASLDEEDGLTYLKLHGSLDWIEDEQFGICSLESPPHRQAPTLEGQPPLLIFGTDSKLTGKEPFLTLLYRFSRSLENSTLLVTIGYSFADAYLNEIISQRFGANTRLGVVAVGNQTIGACVDNVPALRNSPRVARMTDGAKSVLEKKTLLLAVRERLSENATAEPF